MVSVDYGKVIYSQKQQQKSSRIPCSIFDFTLLKTICPRHLKKIVQKNSDISSRMSVDLINMIKISTEDS